VRTEKINYSSLGEFVEKAGEYTNYLIVVPTQKKAHFVSEEFSGRLYAPAIFTLSQLLLDLHREKRDQHHLISTTQQVLIWERVLNDNRDEISWELPETEFPGLANKLRDFFYQLTQNLLSVDQGIAHESLKKDVLFLRNCYERFLEEKKLIDMDMIARRGPDMIRSANLPFEDLGIDTLHYNTPLDQKLLEELKQKFTHVKYFSNLNNTEENEVLSFPGGEKEDDNNTCEEEILVYFNREEEVRGVAREICDRLKNGSKPQEILITSPSIEEYLPLIKEYFPLYGLTYDISHGLSLQETAPARILKTLLELIETPYNRAILVRLFGNELVNYGGGGIRRIDEFAREFNFNDLEPFFLGEIDLNSLVDHKLARDLQKDLEIVKEFLEEFICPLARAEKTGDFFSGLKKILLELNILSGIVSSSIDVGISQIREDGIAMRQLYEVLDETEGLFKKGILPGENPGKEIKRALEKLIGEKEFYIPHQSGSIQVTGLLNLRGWPAEKLFFLGVTAENFPPVRSRNFLLAGSSSREALEESRQIFRELMKSSNEINISYPAQISGRENQASPLLEGFREKTPQAMKNIESFYSNYDILNCLGKSEDRNLWRKFSHKEDLDLWQMETEREKNIPSPFCGLIGKNETEGIVSLAVTAIEDYWTCPMKYYFKWVLKLREREEVEEEEEFARLGMHIHRILEEFGDEGGFHFLKEDLDKARLLLSRIAHRVIQDEGIELEKNIFINSQYQKWLEGLDDSDEGKGIFMYFLEEEKKRIDELNPKAFELELKEENSLPEVGGIRLKGRVDRMDLWKDDGLVVYDYKTGNYPSPKSIKEKRYLQLPLYLLALKNLPSYQDKLIAGTYYQLNFKNKAGLGTVVGDKVGKIFGRKRVITLEDLGGEEELERIIGKVKEGIEAGKHPLTSWKASEAGCKRCSYRLICRKEKKGAVEND